MCFYSASAAHAYGVADTLMSLVHPLLPSAAPEEKKVEGVREERPRSPGSMAVAPEPLSNNLVMFDTLGKTTYIGRGGLGAKAEPKPTRAKESFPGLMSGNTTFPCLSLFNAYDMPMYKAHNLNSLSLEALY